MSLSLKNKLIISTVLLALVIGAMAFFTLTRQINQTLNAQIEAGQSKVVNHAFQLVALYLERAQDSLIRLAEDPSIIEFLEQKDPEKSLHVSEKLTIVLDILQNVGLHEIIGSTCVARSASKAALSVVGTDFSDRDYCRGILKSQSSYLSSAYVSVVTLEPVLGLAIPVKNSDGKMLGYVLGIINLERLRDHLLNLQEHGSFVALFDRYGVKFLDTRQKIEKLDEIGDGIIKLMQGENGFCRQGGDFICFKKTDSFTIAVGEQTSHLFYQVKTLLTITTLIFLLTLIVFVILLAIIIEKIIAKEREIDKMKTEFVSMASHQLQSPITSIRWCLERLVNGKEGELAEKHKKLLSGILYTTREMSKLLSDLLNVSRFEGGKLRIELQPVSLLKLIQEIIGEQSSLIAKKFCKIDLEIPEDFPPINLDPRLMGEIIRNLVVNAMNYSPLGKGKIKIKLEKLKNNYLFSISDNGIGIPKEVQGKVFNKFFRADNARKVRPKGTGLGLYIAKYVLESANCKIWLESEENKGTTFYVSIPIAGMKSMA